MIIQSTRRATREELIKIIEELQKENKELKKDNKALVDNYGNVLANFVSKSKIVKRKEEIDKIYPEETMFSKEFLITEIQSLMEG